MFYFFGVLSDTQGPEPVLGINLNPDKALLGSRICLAIDLWCSLQVRLVKRRNVL